MKFYIVDVFANGKYQGNQLAVFEDFENRVSQEEMQQIAREINFAETTFIKQNTDNQRFIVKIFTPEHEIPFAGHPSIGTSFVIAKFILPEVQAQLTLALAHCDIEISIADPDNIDTSIINMVQAQPEFRETFTHQEIADELGIEGLDLSMPIQEISTGLPYIVIPMKDLKSIEKLKFSYATIQHFLEKRSKYRTNSRTGHSTSLFFFTKETYETGSDYNTRMILLENGRVSEDAATGSANGCFLAYLLKYESANIRATVEQGFQMNRKSYIYLDGLFDNESYKIGVGGRSQLISQGVWYI